MSARDEMLGWPWVVVGHALLVLMVTSFFRCSGTPPGAPSAAWTAAAAAGEVPAVRHRKTGTLLPPRARYVWRHGAAVLHLDHYCWWIDRPIGRANRKFFVLFLLWSAALAAFGALLCACDLHRHYAAMRARAFGPLAGGEASLDLGGVSALEMHPVMLLVITFDSLGPSELIHMGGLLACGVFDLVAAVLLALFGGGHLRMALRNRTTLEPPGEEHYDLGGAVANLRQVFGTRCGLWPLPVLQEPEGDGHEWPTRAAGGAAPPADRGREDDVD